MRTIYPITKSSILMACLLLFTCTNEPVEVENELVLDSEIEQDDGLSSVPLEESLDFFKSLNTTRVGLTTNSFNLNIDLNSLEQVPISNTDAKLNIAKATTKFNNIETSVLQINIDGQVQTVLFNVIPKDAPQSRTERNAISGYNFTGNIVITNISGIVLNNYAYNSGNLLGEINLNSYNPDPVPCWGIGCGIDLEEVVITAPTVSPYYYAYTNHYLISNVYQWNRSLNNYSTMGTAYANYYRQLAIDEFEENIDETNLKPCLKNILKVLKNIQNGPGNMVAKFSGNFPGYNWVTKSGSLSGQTASTNSPSTYNANSGIITTFDTQAWTNATDLSWARTILHESIHAFLASYYKINRPNWIATYPQMVQDWGSIQNWNGVHHEEIARSLVSAVALALEDYGKMMGYNLSAQFYEDMAWGGLQNTSTFKALSASDQKRILDTIATELTGSDTNSNIKTQKGRNAGC